MSLDTFSSTAIAQADRILERQESRGRIASVDESTSPVEATPEDTRKQYQKNLFLHTNNQYLRAKQKLARQVQRKSRQQNTQSDDIDVQMSKLSTESSNSSAGSY